MKALSLKINTSRFGTFFEKLNSSMNLVRLSMQEQAIFAKRLSLLVKAGVSVFDSLKMLEKSATSKSKKKMFGAIANDVAQGQYLSKSLGKYKKTFGEFAINIIYVGETTGTLAENLRYLASEVDKKRRLRAKVVGALVYPLVIMVASIGICALMTVYLFPKLLPIFKSLNVTLPFTTRALIFLSDFLINYWSYLLGGFVTFVIAFLFLLKWKPFRYAVDSITLKIPIFGTLMQYYHIINMTRTLGILFKSQVRILEAAEIASTTCSNTVYSKAIMELKGEIIKGSTISKFFNSKPRLFPPMLTQMIDIGEKTGNLSDTLIYLGEMYEEELDEQTKRLSSTIEPLTMIVMGVLVGFIAVSIITPIYEVTQHLNPR